MAGDRRWAIWTLYFIVFVDLFQVTFVFPFIPMIVASFATPAETPAQVAYLSSLSAIGQMVGNPLLGWVSDKFGRRPVFILSTLGSTASAILFGYAHSFQVAAAARVVNGLSGGTAGLANTYLIDITTDEERPKLMARMTGFIGIGLTLGPIAGGFLFRQFGVQAACLCAGAISFANFVLIAAVLVESSQVTQGDAAPGQQGESGGGEAGNQSAGAGAGEAPASGNEAAAAAEAGEAIASAAATATESGGAAAVASEEAPSAASANGRCGLPRFSQRMWILFISGLFLSPISVVFDTFANLYITETFYNNDEQKGTVLFSNCVASIGVCLLIVPLFLYNHFLDCVGFNGSIVVGMGTVALGLVANGLAPVDWMFLAATVTWAFGFQLMGPVIPILIARLAPKEMLGRAFGLFGSVSNISMVIGPTALTPLYNFKHEFVFYFLGACMLVVGAILLFINMKTTPATSGSAREVAEETPAPLEQPALLRQLSRTSTVNSLRQLGGLSSQVKGAHQHAVFAEPLLRTYSEPRDPPAPPVPIITRALSLPAPRDF